MIGKALEIISGYVTAPSTTETALTMGDSDTLQVRDAPQGAYLVNVWGKWQTTAGLIRITSPKLHDNSGGIKLNTVLNEVYPLMPMGVLQPLYSQDTLKVKATGSATSGDIESVAMLLFYPELRGSNCRLIDEATLQANKLNWMPVEVDITAGTSGGYSGSRAINADNDYFKANTDYAVVGASIEGVNTLGTCVATLKGTDTGNLRIGFPTNPINKDVTREFFLNLSRVMRQPMIPVINSSNRANTICEVVNDENANSPKITWHLWELRKGTY